MDGLVLPGGPDPHPSLWGEAVHPTTVIDEPRDRLEYALLKGCIERGIPVLGVCRGLQVINVVRGGTLVQDLPPGPLDHRGAADRTVLAHDLHVLEDSRMADIVRAQAGAGQLRAPPSDRPARDRADGLRVG